MKNNNKNKSKISTSSAFSILKLRHQANFKIYSGNSFIHSNSPAKIINTTLPQLPDLPSYIPVNITKTQTIHYQKDSKLVNIKKEQFLNYDGKLNLSVAQFEISVSTLPKIVKQNLVTIKSINLWYYKQNRKTLWHYDGNDNFLYVLEGKKIIYLSKPNSMECLGVFSINNNQTKYQQTTKGKLKVILKKGECLFIPKGWFHKVLSIGKPIIAINFWGNSLSEIKKCEEDITFRYLVNQISQREVKKEIERLLQKNSELKQKYEKIMKAQFHELTIQQIVTPIEYEFLAIKLDSNKQSDLTEFWKQFSYDDFIRMRQETKKTLFMQYLQNLI